MAIELDKDTCATAEVSIKKYFEKNFDLSIGNIEAGGLLLFFLKEIGPCVYNKAVLDVQQKLNERVMEIDSYIYEDEFTYWQTQKRRK